jgi:hypothetical protein
MNINFTLVMQALAFGAFVWFCAKFVWPPLMGAIENRQKQIADGLAAGEAGKQNLANAERRIADMLAEAKVRSSEIITQGEKLRTETIETAKHEAKGEADRILAAARGRRRRGPDPQARGRRQGARRPARRDPAAAVGPRAPWRNSRPLPVRTRRRRSGSRSSTRRCLRGRRCWTS